jgi:hypothetical protein
MPVSKVKELKPQSAPVDSPGVQQNYGGLIGLEKYPLIYMNMPKSACTTIKNIFYKLEYGSFCEDPVAIHRQIQNGSALVGRAHPALLRDKVRQRKLAFTFVRDPVERAYSCYIEKIHFVSPYSFRAVRKFLIRHRGVKLPAEDSPVQVDLETHKDNFLKFLEFVRDNIHGKTRVRKDPHWLPQASMVANCPGGIILDFIGRVSTYKRDMAYILNSVGYEDLAILEMRFNEGPKPPFRFAEAVDQRMNEMAREIYKADYKAFGSF